MNRFATGAAVLVFLGAAGSRAFAQQPPTGVVYGCYSSSTSGPSFTLVDGKTYMSRQGGRGTYSYAPGTGVLTMVDGPYKGIRYLKQSSEFSFRVLRDQSMEITQTSCPINRGKDPNKRPW